MKIIVFPSIFLSIAFVYYTNIPNNKLLPSDIYGYLGFFKVNDIWFEYIFMISLWILFIWYSGTDFEEKLD